MSPPPDTPRGFREYLPIKAGEETQPLGRLVQQFFQRWRVAPLIEKGAVLVEGTTTIVRPRKVDHVPARGESVAVDSPWPEADRELQRLADTSAANWVMAFGADLADATPASVEGFEHLPRIGYMLRARPGSAMLPRSVRSLQELVEILRRWPDRPVRTVLLSSHGTPFSELMVPWKRLTPGVDVDATDYEDLEQVLSPTILSGTNQGQPNPDYLSLGVSGETTLPRPLDARGDKVPAALHLKGCQLGRHPEYLKKLKEALAPGIDVVTAPRFMQGVSRPRDPAGFIEFFDYEYRLFRPTRLATQAQVVAAFQAEGFKLLDGSRVDPRRWPEWVHRNPATLANHQQVPTGEVRVTTAIRRLPRITLHARFMYDEVRMPNFTLEAPALPTSQAELKRLIRERIARARPKWQDDHPFSMPKRMGYRNVQELVDGFTWDAKPIDPRASPLTLSINGVRHDYVVWTPVLDGPTELFMNWYPDDTRQQPIIQIKETDTRFFGIA